VNEHAPVLNKASYTCTLREDVSTGAACVTVEATDQDKTGNTLKYTLTGGGGVFTIDASSGEVTTAKTLDREAQIIYFLTITVEDSGMPKLSANAELTVTVSDFNDNTPRFESSTYTKSLSESAAAGVEIATVKATDKDEVGSDNSLLTFAITNANGYEDTFAIRTEGSEGIITLKGSLDYEAVKEYVLTISVSDGGTPQLSSTATVVLTVTDINDVAPVFVDSEYGALISEDFPLGGLVLVVQAQDPDTNQGGVIKYGFSPLSTPARFAINSATGGISTTATFDFETDDTQYPFTVRATDQGDPSLYTDVAVTVILVDVNDLTPQFELATYKKRLVETESTGLAVVTVLASEADTNAKITYEVTAGNEDGVFKLVNDKVK